MKDRIKLVMDSEGMTPARFADTLQIGRPVLSHILNGRNNPSLDVISRILSEMPQINAEWLISGKGSMYKNGYEKSQNSSPTSDMFMFNSNQPDLFAQNYTEPTNGTDKIKYDKEKELSTPQKNNQYPINETIKYIERPEKRISKIIIYYSDNTYEEFNPEK